jgi:serine/threonine protein kinase
VTAERWQQIESLYHSALEHPPTERRAFVATVCSGDEELQLELESLLASHDTAGDFIEEPVASAAARALSNRQNAILVGREIGHYKVLSLLGKGGMGEVYLAEDTTLQRKVALKLFHTHLAGESETRERFMREARLASSLDHPNICTVYEVGEVEGRQFIAMRYVQGKTLKQLIAGQPLSLESLFSISLQVADALAVAHSHGVIHRDIKAENIMVAPDGRVQVFDFGIAKLLEKEKKDTRLTMTGRVMGTPAVMSPEQARGQSVDERTDIFSFGAIMYEMATGRLPFIGQTQADVISAVLKEPHRSAAKINKKIPFRLSAVIDRALAKDPAGRYQSMPKMISDLRQAATEPGGLAKHCTRLRWAAAATALLLVAAMIAGFILASKKLRRSTSIVSDKSIAVLPFENLSEDKANAFFADGVQDEILTDLSRIADLKVISRTSVMHYKSPAPAGRNLREIGQQLGVANVVEGSVQRSGNRVRVNAQLVDARTDQHLWAQTYDRDLADVFAIQSEIAKAIADQLQAKLSPTEKSAIERPPTNDIDAFDLYTLAKNLLVPVVGSSSGNTDILEAVDLLNQAVARAPSFFDAYCQLAYAHEVLYFYGLDHSAARLALAEAAIQTASGLRPDAGETHLVRAQNLYWGYLDYDGALAELEIARRTLPNDSRVLQWRSNILKRQGHWEESIRTFERAMELDPRNVLSLQGTFTNFAALRQYDKEKFASDRLLAAYPDDAYAKATRGVVEFDRKADTRPLHQTIDSIRATDPAAVPSIAAIWLMCALAERDPAAAKAALTALGENPMFLGLGDNIGVSRPFIEGVIAQMTKDDNKARAAFTAARVEQEKIVQAQPNYGPALCVLGLIDAGLGRKEEALREGRRAVELLPISKDALGGTHMNKYLALIAAWVGDNDLACEQLAIAIPRMCDLSYGQLKLMPWWDPLRGDPRFEKIVEDAKQPVALRD